MAFSDYLILTVPIAAIALLIALVYRKVIELQTRIDAIQSALVALEKNTNEQINDLQSKVNKLTAIKIEDITDALTSVSDLSPSQKLRRLARAREITIMAFQIVKDHGTTTPLHDKTKNLMLLLLERAEKLVQAQLVAEGKKGGFERGGVVSFDTGGAGKTDMQGESR